MKKVVVCLALMGMALSSCETKTETAADKRPIVSNTPEKGVDTAEGDPSAIISPLMESSLSLSERHTMQQFAPRTLKRIDHREQLTLYDIKQMTHVGIDDKVIIEQIYDTKSKFNVTSADIVDLKDSGVSQNVIDVMLGY